MHETVRESRLFRFGAFELTAGTGEVRKDGKRLSRLQAQPLQVLLMLLERHGEVITREELRRKIWSSDTFVDFDHGVNTAINKLRGALGDSASNPRFIQTLPRIGYRFIAPVEEMDTGAPQCGPILSVRGIDGMPQPDTIPESSPPAVKKFLSQPHDLPAAPHRLTCLLFSLVQLMYLGFYVAALARLPEAQSRLADFTGRSVTAYVVLILAALAGIPVRLYLLSAIAFQYRGLSNKFQKIFPYIFPLDEIWALSPFLIAREIGLGLALAATAALVYLPFAERSLLLMGTSASFSPDEKKQ